jgi:hypothetical protein
MIKDAYVMRFQYQVPLPADVDFDYTYIDKTGAGVWLIYGDES